MSIFESIFNKEENKEKSQDKGGIKTNADKLKERIDSEKSENIEVLKNSYEYLLQHANDVGLTKQDMEEVLLSQIEDWGVSPDVYNHDKNSTIKFSKKILTVFEKNFGVDGLSSKIKEKFGLNHHLGNALYPYIDMESYPDIKKLSSEKIFLFVESGLIKIEPKYKEDFIENIKSKAIEEFILKNISPDIVKTTMNQMTKMSEMLRQEELRNDIIKSDKKLVDIEQAQI